ncbi:hypothetical protein ACVW1C_008516 [Bradyrhizobium sp. USDA 4011]|jgi:hypothetical protein|uniref:hypothetical protein n=1 Tax=Bradyrhizobium TaxID=374 RepID=UPI0004865DC2|nr:MULTISPECIES: hypothetical protein [Bradyrhizobium]MCL8488279.1 hypothetical protein [Bradyrhizobium denitrificans]RTM15533.1 MAG: hypothetical protein EKK33_00850 [Bradyrhizobiaceae bacterium]
MRFVRTILAFAIAASLALAPLGASATGLAMTASDSTSTMQMEASADMSMDCCPDDTTGTPIHSEHHKCGSGFCCVGSLTALGDVRSIAFRFDPAAERKAAIPADQIVTVQAGNPPFRPPRI